MAPVGGRRGLTHGVDTRELLRAQVREVHRELDEAFGDWLRTLGPGGPPTGSRVVALYVHAATVEDITVHSLLRQVPPVFQKDWAGSGPGRYSTADLLPVRAYAQQVFVATDAYLAGMAAGDVSQTVDLSRLGHGTPTVAWVISKFVVLQLAQIYGELTNALRDR